MITLFIIMKRIWKRAFDFHFYWEKLQLRFLTPPTPLLRGELRASALFVIALILIVPTAQADFKDVERWIELGIATAELQELGIIEGFGGNVFLPDKQVSRAAFTKMVTASVFKAKDITNCLTDSSFGFSNTIAFRDVPVGEWFAPYICIAKKKGLINGYADQTFRPEQNVSYVEAAKIVVEAIGKNTSDQGEWYEQYWDALAETGAIDGIDFRPFEPITRGDTALILYRLFFTKNAPYNVGAEPSPLSALPTASSSPTARASPLPDFSSAEDVNSIPKNLPEVDFDNEDCEEIVAKVFSQSSLQQKSDCLRHEQYDTSRQRCEPKCSSSAECDRIDVEVSKLAEEILEFGSGEVPDSAYFSLESPVTIRLYQVEDFALTNPRDYSVAASLRSFQQNETEHQTIWNTFVNVFPLEYLTAVEEFVIFSDGIDGVASDTSKLAADEYGIKFAFDPADIGDLLFVLTHEYAHLIALSEKEDQIGLVADICRAENFDGKENMRDSYLKEFRERFWEEYGERFLELESITDDSARNALMRELGEKYTDHFLTDYALTSPEEDFAESFAVFVWSDQPTQNAPAYDKIRFFYDYPELTRLRQAVRWQVWNVWAS